MRYRYNIMALAALLLVAGCNESRRGNDSNLNEDRNEAAAESNTDKFAGKARGDADFVYETVAENYGEIKLAELAVQRSRTSEVKDVAQSLLNEHTTSLNDLKRLAQAKAISVPVEEKESSKRKLENIAEESGGDFDRAWVKEMIDAHENSIDKFEDREDDTEDAEVKAYIEKTLPVLREHLEGLKACKESLEKNG